MADPTTVHVGILRSAVKQPFIRRAHPVFIHKTPIVIVAAAAILIAVALASAAFMTARWKGSPTLLVAAACVTSFHPAVRGGG